MLLILLLLRLLPGLIERIIRLLLLVADKNKPSQLRVAKYARQFPASTLAALAELLALPEPPARPGYPHIEAKKLPQQQKKRAEGWRMLLRTLLNTHPPLAEQVSPWLSAQARELLATFQQSLPAGVTVAVDNPGLPEILLSPPWRSKKKKAAAPRFALSPLKLAPQEYWQPGEREALAAGKPACFFNDLPLRERIRRKGGIVLRELGFEDMYYLFHQYTLNGQQIHFEPQYHRYSEKPVWNEAAMQAFHAETVKPTCIIMDTTKGKGVSYMTNSVDWHGKGPNDDEYKIAIEELNAAYAALEQEEN